MSKPVLVGSLRVGQNVIIDGEPCKIVELEKSKPGKHGSAKARLVAMGIFDNQKRSMISPVDGRVDVPMIDKRSGQVISMGDAMSIMDSENYEMLEVPLPSDEEIRRKIEPGVTVEYWKIMNRFMIVNVKS
ncbi:MAG: translation initiation factor IF-5A [Aigarchaeota archaeon]|nr:translation initiation factor IF-5A [Aigarchaeota archaeon]